MSLTSRHSYRRAAAAAVLAATGVMAGCGSGSGAADSYPASGVVTLNGQPVEGAIVTFTPASAEPGVGGGQASTDASGRFEMSHLRDNGQTTVAGLPAGEYRVTVTKIVAPAGEASLTKPPRNTLPAQYQSVEETPLSANVTPEGENHFDFPL